jgi:hypothetical protein
VDSAIASVIVAFIASIGGVLIAVIQKSRKENRGDHNMVKQCIDLLRDDDITFIHKHYSTILWSIHAVVALISINLWLYFLSPCL